MTKLTTVKGATPVATITILDELGYSSITGEVVAKKVSDAIHNAFEDFGEKILH